jgi:hypothetical protein
MLSSCIMKIILIWMSYPVVLQTGRNNFDEYTAPLRNSPLSGFKKAMQNDSKFNFNTQ